MKITLTQLELLNFKGVFGKWVFKEGRNIFKGKNGTGKTTMCDAISWLKDGKDSEGKSDSGKKSFAIKTIVNEQPTSKGRHTVTGTYRVDGKEWKFERSFMEDWSTSRGSVEETLKGHITTYKINNRVTKTKKEFDAVIYEVFGDEVFKLTSDPTYFAGLKWQDRRKTLITLAGKIDTDKIIDSIPELRRLSGDHTVEQNTEIAAQRKKAISDEIKTLPAVIDELKQQLAKATGGASLKDAQFKVDEIKRDTALIKIKIDDFKSGNNSKVLKKLTSLNEQLRVAVSEFETDKNKAHKLFTSQKNRIDQINNEIEKWGKEIEKFDEGVTNLILSRRTIKSEEYEEKGNACHYCDKPITCSHCNEEDVESQKLFNRSKSEKLKTTIDNGKEFASARKKAEQIIIDLKKEKKDLEPLTKPEILSWSGNALIDDLQAQIKKIDNDKPGNEPPTELLEKLETLNADLAEALELSASIKATADTKKRIEELEEQKKKLSGEFDEVEKVLFLIGRYNKKLTETTEKPINDLFNNVRFRMFNTQTNGSIIPTCDIMSLDNKPYDTALSGGEKLKIGLDSINTFSEHFKMYSPVFIDNAESITDMPSMDTQTIELRVSEEHNELTQL